MNKLIKFGEKYSKKYLSDKLEEKTLKNVREGIFNCKNTKSAFLFVTLDKSNKKETLDYNDYYEKNLFHWDSQNRQHINTPVIKEIITGSKTTYLFARITNKIKNITCPFIYCGKLIYDSHDKKTSNPVHIIFKNIDYDHNTENKDLINLYEWRPEKTPKK